MMNSKWMGVAAGALIVVALIILFARLDRPSQELAFDLPEYIGFQLAEQAVGLRGDTGDILFIKADLAGVEDPYVAAYQQGFIKSVGSLAPDATVIETGLTADPMDLQAGKPIFGAGVLSGLVRDYPQCTVFVSVAGLPEVTRSQLNAWNEAKPELVVFAPFGGPVDQLIKAGVLDAAIVPRTGELPDGEEAGNSVEDQFAQDYQILPP